MTASIFKITIIGAGSVGFTKKLCSDILKVPEFAGSRDRTDRHQRPQPRHDRPDHPADRFRSTACRTKVTATTDRREALEGARYVMNCVRIGGLEAFADDIRIPLKYGVDQCVGDTICAGGICTASAASSAMLEFCRDISEVAEPDALLLNYANPMAMMTWAAIDHGGVTHGRPLPRRAERPPPDRPGARGADGTRSTSSARASTTRPGISTSCTDGRKIGREELLAAFERASGVLPAGEGADRRLEAVRILLDRIERPSVGVPAVVPQAARRDQRLDRPGRLDPWRDRRLPALLDREPQLVRGGLPEVPRGGRQAARRATTAPTSMPATSWRRWRPGGSTAATSTCSNGGAITNLPEDCIIESPGFVDRFGINMVDGHHPAGRLRRDLHRPASTCSGWRSGRR